MTGGNPSFMSSKLRNKRAVRPFHEYRQKWHVASLRVQLDEGIWLPFDTIPLFAPFVL